MKLTLNQTQHKRPRSHQSNTCALKYNKRILINAYILCPLLSDSYFKVHDATLRVTHSLSHYQHININLMMYIIKFILSKVATINIRFQEMIKRREYFHFMSCNYKHLSSSFPFLYLCVVISFKTL